MHQLFNSLSLVACGGNNLTKSREGSDSTRKQFSVYFSHKEADQQSERNVLQLSILQRNKGSCKSGQLPASDTYAFQSEINKGRLNSLFEQMDLLVLLA